MLNRFACISLVILLAFPCVIFAQDRFVKDSNGIITDNDTGLQWCIAPEDPYSVISISWYDANNWVLGLGGDWDLPTVSQLTELYNSGVRTENWGVFGNKGFTGFWVWSREISGVDSAWKVNFDDGTAILDGQTFASAFRFGRTFAVRLGVDRFTMENDIITDSRTGLEWRVCNSLSDGPNSCHEWLKTLGAGWRLPTLEELQTLYCAGINSNHMGFFDNDFDNLENCEYTWFPSEYGYDSVFEFNNGEEFMPGNSGCSYMNIVPFAVRTP